MRLLGIAIASALLAGCASNLGSTNGSLPQVVQPQSFGSDFECRFHGGVRVSPCHVHFTRRFRGPESIMVKSPNGNGGMLTESDNCRNVARVSGSGSSWRVRALRQRGLCLAVFSWVNVHNHKTLGWAHLRIRASRP
jgi:hypothetical protein